MCIEKSASDGHRDIAAQMLQVTEAQAGLLLELAVGGEGPVLAPVDVSGRKLPHHAAQRVTVLADADGPVGVVQGQDDHRADPDAEVGVGHLARVFQRANLVHQHGETPAPGHL